MRAHVGPRSARLGPARWPHLLLAAVTVLQCWRAHADIEPVGLNQRVLVMYAQAHDYQILPADLAGVNAQENTEVSQFRDFYTEVSWNQMSFNVDQTRANAANAWYTLPKGLMEYATPRDIEHTDVRDPGSSVNANPTPPTVVAAEAQNGGSFAAGAAGVYWYGVASYSVASTRESALVWAASNVTVGTGQRVRVTFTKAAAPDVTWFIVYRTRNPDTMTTAAVQRMGQVLALPLTNDYEFTDNNDLPRTASHSTLVKDTCTLAAANVPDFTVYEGIIVILYATFLRGSARGQWEVPECGGATVRTIYQSEATPWGRFAHEIGHWLGLPDEYDPVTAGGRNFYTTMDGANDRQFAAWEKEHKLPWVTAPDMMMHLERPAPGNPDFVGTYRLRATHQQDNDPGVYTTVRIKAAEGVHYYIEARDNPSAPGAVSDQGVIADSVVVMEAVDAWPPGIYPKRPLNVQMILAAGGTWQPEAGGPVEIEYTQLVPATNPKEYEVTVTLKAEPQPDLKITPWGAPPWKSEDIWVDSSREGGGWDNPATAEPKEGNGERAWVDNVNRVFARVYNIGDGDAVGVVVRFCVNTPGGMGDSGQFVDLVTPAAQDIPGGEWRNFYAEWTPEVDEHTCIKVEIEHYIGEADIHNNYAQENFNKWYTGSNSPWHPFTIPIRVANPFLTRHRIALEAWDLLPGWTVDWALPDPNATSPEVDVDAKSFIVVHATVTPKGDEPTCTQCVIDFHAKTELGDDDWITTYGGMNALVTLANPIGFKYGIVRTDDGGDGQRNTWFWNDAEQGAATGSSSAQLHGNLVTFAGSTSPPLAQQELALILTDPAGVNHVYFTTTTDTGFFSVVGMANTPGWWTGYVWYKGDDCHAPTTGPKASFWVGGPGSGGGGGGGGGGDDDKVCVWCCVVIVLLLLLILVVVVVVCRRVKRKGRGKHVPPPPPSPRTIRVTPSTVSMMSSSDRYRASVRRQPLEPGLV